MKKIQTNKRTEVLYTPEEVQKRHRTALTELLLVNSTSGTFNGNERSQERIRRAIDFAEATSTASVQWVLADGTIADVPVAELKTVYFSAMEKQHAIFVRAQAGQLTTADVKTARAEYDAAGAN